MRHQQIDRQRLQAEILLEASHSIVPLTEAHHVLALVANSVAFRAGNALGASGINCAGSAAHSSGTADDAAACDTCQNPEVRDYLAARAKNKGIEIIQLVNERIAEAELAQQLKGTWPSNFGTSARDL